MGDKLDEIMDAEDPSPEELEVAESEGKEPQPEEEQQAQEKGEEKETEPPAEKKEPTLEERLAQLEGQNKSYQKERKGQLTALKAERRKRQETEEKLNNLTGTLSEVLEKRQAAKQPEKEEEPELSHLDLEVDDDGNLRIPADRLKDMTKKDIDAVNARIQKLEQSLQNQSAKNEMVTGFQQFIGSVVNEDPSYRDGIAKIHAATDWLDQVTQERQEELGQPARSIGEFVEKLDDIGVSDEFKTKFGVDPEIVLRGFESKRDLRKALKAVSANGQPKEEPKEDPKEKARKVKELAQKPSNLTQTKNARGAPTVVDNIEGLSFDDLLNISDDDADKLLKEIGQESP